MKCFIIIYKIIIQEQYENKKPTSKRKYTNGVPT